MEKSEINDEAHGASKSSQAGSVASNSDIDMNPKPKHSSMELNISRASSATLCSSELDGVTGSLIKTCALKSLAVLINNSRVLDKLVLDKNAQTGDCEMVKVLKTIMHCMVVCAVLPSPVRRVVNLGELERAQTVMLNMASTAKKLGPKDSEEMKGK